MNSTSTDHKVEHVVCGWQNITDELTRLECADSIAHHAKHVSPATMTGEYWEDPCDAWVCVCGNDSDGAGLFPCDINGNGVEPTHTDWTTNLWRCDGCGRIIEGTQGYVVGRAENVTYV